MTGLGIWIQALSFYLKNLPGLIMVLPLLCFPVIGDVLSSLLISQFIQTKSIYLKEALAKAFKLAPSLLFMKLYFEGAALLWSLIPVYGIIRDIRYRQYWAMASNVLVFEGMAGDVGRNRCREIAENNLFGIGVRTLVTIPSLLFVAIIVAWLICGSLIEVFYVYGFWLTILGFYFVIFPLSGAVNTFLYLAAVRKESLH